jgi:hypothetical protein
VGSAGQGALSRRRVLALAGTGVAVAAAGAVAAACGSGSGGGGGPAPAQGSAAASGSASAQTSAPAGGGGSATTLKPINGGALGSIDAKGNVTLNGTGADIWEPGDDFVFADQPWTSGDGDWSCRVVSVADGSAPVNEWAKTGIMVRESTDRLAAMFLVAATGNHGVINNSRQEGASGSGSVPQQDSTNTNDSGTIGPDALQFPVWLRVTRKKDTFQAYTSTDGKKWNSFGNSVDVPMKTVLVGLAALSHNSGNTDIAKFDNVKGFVPTKIEQVGNP